MSELTSNLENGARLEYGNGFDDLNWSPDGTTIQAPGAHFHISLTQSIDKIVFAHINTTDDVHPLCCFI